MLGKFALGLIILFSTVTAWADQIKYMRHGEESLATFLHVINSAEKSIDLTTFIFEPCDASARVLIEALVKKARGGVQVRILLDSFYQTPKQAKDLGQFFQENKIQLRWYAPALLNFNFRSHTKLLLVDGKRYITGGRNISDQYFSLFDGENFFDRDIYVAGNSAQQALKSFELLWNSKQTKPAAVPAGRFAGWSAACEYNEDEKTDAVRASMKQNAAQLFAGMPTRTCQETHFFADEPGAKILDAHTNGVVAATAAKKHVTAEMLKFIKGTKKKLIIENWSFMPHSSMSYEFFDLRWKKIPVLVLTNDNLDGSTGLLKKPQDNFHNRAANLRNKGSVVVKQLSMYGSLRDDWELSPPNAVYRLHGKVGVRDDKDVVVSSFNIDHRSYGLNLESMVLVKDCPELAADLNGEFRELGKVYRQDLEDGVLKNDQESDGVLWSLLGILGYSFL